MRGGGAVFAAVVRPAQLPAAAATAARVTAVAARAAGVADSPAAAATAAHITAAGAASVAD